MTIGILSMQRVVNYGSILQAYALKKTLEKYGEVKFADIEKGEEITNPINNFNEYGKNENIICRCKGKFNRYFFKRVRNKFRQYKVKRKFIEYQKELLNVSENADTKVKCDVLLIGSDEIFNCMHSSEWGLSLQLFGKYDYAQKIITYSASCGMTSYNDIPSDYIQKISNAMCNISSVSVRDENTKSFAEKITNKKVFLHLDPVFIYDFKNEKRDYKINCKYILIYAYTNRIYKSEDIKIIRNFAKKKNCKLVAVGGFQFWCDINLILHPFEVLSVFENAEYVITDTFHGSVLSIKYHKNFISSVHNSNKNKVYDLLERFGFDNRVSEKLNSIINLLEISPEYDKCDKIIFDECIKTKQYFNDNLLFED